MTHPTTNRATKPGIRVNYLLPLVLLIPLLLLGRQQSDSARAGEPPDTLVAKAPDFALVGPLFHHPPVAILNDRPFRMDFFVNFDPEEIESVGLFIKGDSSHTFREIPLTEEYGRYRYVLQVEELQGSALTYYFLVTLKEYRLWAYPRGEDGRIEPFVIDLVPPTKEFFQKRYYD